jgi:membrane protein DedA with SNARE-associated domain
MDHALTALVVSYGPLAIFLFMVAEGCGLPIPSEIVLPVGGVLAILGHVNLLAVIAAGTAGNLVGAVLAFVLAARWGRSVLLGPGRWLGISSRHLDLADRWFLRYGWVAVLVCRLLPVARSYVSFPAGLARMRLLPFALLTVVGSLPWCAALTLVGYELGAHYTRVSRPIQEAAIVCALLLVVLLVGWVIRGRSLKGRSADKDLKEAGRSQ